MFFIGGVGVKTTHEGPGGQRTCPRCHNTTVWQRYTSFRQLTMFFVIPLWRWGRTRFEQCGICGTTTPA